MFKSNITEEALSKAIRDDSERDFALLYSLFEAPALQAKQGKEEINLNSNSNTNTNSKSSLDINYRSAKIRRQNTALHFAANQNNFIYLERLLQNKSIEINIQNYDGETPLLIACRKNLLPHVEAFLEKGAEVNLSSSRDGKTPLHFAAVHGNLAMVKLLVEGGAHLNINEVDNGQSALSLAAAEGHVDVIEYLIVSGASTKNAEPLTKAIENKHTKAVVTLLRYGLGINYKLNDSLQQKWLELTSNEKNFNIDYCYVLDMTINNRPIPTDDFSLAITNLQTANSVKAKLENIIKTPALINQLDNKTVFLRRMEIEFANPNLIDNDRLALIKHYTLLKNANSDVFNLQALDSIRRIFCTTEFDGCNLLDIPKIVWQAPMARKKLGLVTLSELLIHGIAHNRLKNASGKTIIFSKKTLQDFRYPRIKATKTERQEYGQEHTLCLMGKPIQPTVLATIFEIRGLKDDVLIENLPLIVAENDSIDTNAQTALLLNWCREIALFRQTINDSLPYRKQVGILYITFILSFIILSSVGGVLEAKGYEKVGLSLMLVGLMLAVILVVGAFGLLLEVEDNKECCYCGGLYNKTYLSLRQSYLIKENRSSLNALTLLLKNIYHDLSDNNLKTQFLTYIQQLENPRTTIKQVVHVLSQLPALFDSLARQQRSQEEKNLKLLSKYTGVCFFPTPTNTNKLNEITLVERRVGEEITESSSLLNMDHSQYGTV